MLYTLVETAKANNADSSLHNFSGILLKIYNYLHQDFFSLGFWEGDEYRSIPENEFTQLQVGDLERIAALSLMDSLRQLRKEIQHGKP